MPTPHLLIQKFIEHEMTEPEFERLIHWLGRDPRHAGILQSHLIIHDKLCGLFSTPRPTPARPGAAGVPRRAQTPRPD
ncbi:MAG: hypothetical protein ACIAXF_05190 [Phycisphaerales bacterium JB063]